MAKQEQRTLDIDDEDNYRKMSQPFETPADADKAIQAFMIGVRELRQKHGLADVCVMAKDRIQDSGPFMAHASFGSENEKEAMAAWFLGKVQAERQHRVRNAMDQGLEEAITQTPHRK